MADPITPAPAAAPKKSNTGKIIAIIAVVLLILCAGGIFAAYKLLNKAVDVAYAEGNCVDQLNTGAAASVAIPQPVSCSDSKAKAKILKVYDDKKAADAEELCGNVAGAVSFVEIRLTSGSTKLLCLGTN
jgi:hypothetical protein